MEPLENLVAAPPTGGTFTFSLNGYETMPLPYNATQEEVEKALSDMLERMPKPTLLGRLRGAFKDWLHAKLQDYKERFAEP